MEGETPLHFALKEEKTDIAEDMVLSGADLKAKLGEDNLLHYCIKLNKLRSVQFVHEHDGEQIEEKGQDGKVAIQIAAQLADLEIFEWLNSIIKSDLIRMEDQPEDMEDQPEDMEDQPEDKEAMAVREKLVENVSAGASRLILAALNSDWQECFDILKDSKSFEETSSVQETSIKKDTRTIETSAFGCTFLHAAALNKEKGFYIILYLAPHSKGVDNKDLNGDEAIHYAIMVKNLNIAELLLWFRSYEMNLMNLMHLLVEQNRLELAKTVHEWKKDLNNELDPEGRNALHLAAEYAGKDMSSWLMDENVFDVNAKSRSGETPLHFALRAEKTDIAEDLVLKGADLKVKHGEDNFLHYCIKKNKLRSVQFVHEHDGQLIKEKSQKGKVAIQIAAQFADLEIFKWLNSILIKRGNPFAPLNKNEIPLIHCAAENQNHGPDIIGFLLSKGGELVKNTTVVTGVEGTKCILRCPMYETPPNGCACSLEGKITVTSSTTTPCRLRFATTSLPPRCNFFSVN
ncbi:putative ankyrin repeat protein RF_0381 [Cloeon dipterum]|uniref:putative ankyrin repeat protein RF_0381 n=1 Tax=Cloeon dipterum TaxID=197152 RepID=UPI00321F752D